MKIYMKWLREISVLAVLAFPAVSALAGSRTEDGSTGHSIAQAEGTTEVKALAGGRTNQVSDGKTGKSASYLDGTTLYMGKYLTPDIYLEAMVHLAADRNNGVENTTSFLTSDLSLDTEISLEWENPLCTVQIFTQPSSLNAFEFFDTLGFALSKRFVF